MIGAHSASAEPHPPSELVPDHSVCLPIRVHPRNPRSHSVNEDCIKPPTMLNVGGGLVAIITYRFESARGLAHSKTLRNCEDFAVTRQRFGVRQSSGAFLHYHPASW